MTVAGEIWRRVIVAKPRTTGGGLLLKCRTRFGREDRERVKELVRVMDAAEADRRRPFAESLREHVGDPPGHAERLTDLEARLPLADPGTEPVRCWGCNAPAPRSTFVGKYGWHSRRVRLATGHAFEVQCPTCYAVAGFIEPLHSEG
jgi:hypothetical protein